MDSPTFARAKDKVVFSRNRLKVENQRSPEGSKNSLEMMFGEDGLSPKAKRSKAEIKLGFHIKRLKKYVSRDSEEAEDHDKPVMRQKQLQSRIIDSWKRRSNKKKGYYFSRGDQKAEIRRTIFEAKLNNKTNFSVK